MSQQSPAATSHITLALCGDVMTGRGIDQILPHPGEPTIYEPVLRSAADYVTLAARANGSIPIPVEPAYPWGDALALLDAVAPDARLINLETAVTTSDTPWPGKFITYRMHPANLDCLTAARVDCCTLANNHVLDWGYAGLRETVARLRAVGIRTAGAGANLVEATAPAVIELAGKGRVLVFAWGHPSSGIPRAWAASELRPGVNLLADLSAGTLAQVTARLRAARQPGDLVVVSLHWGDNWGYAIPREHVVFARELVASGGADLIFGHSSHHPIGCEVHRGRLILYGCGDLINDYEGIGGYEVYQPDLGVIVLVTLEPRSGALIRARLLPLRRRRLRLWRVTPDEARWLARRLSDESRELGVQLELQPDGTLELRW